MEIKKVGVLGCGLMGSGIAQVCATAGFDVTVLEVDRSSSTRALPGSRNPWRSLPSVRSRRAGSRRSRRMRSARGSRGRPIRPLWPIAVARHIVEKLIRRHPHVFGESEAKTVEAVWAQWEQIKKAEKHGTKHARPSALDGIPKHLPALLRAEKLVKKASKAKPLHWPTAPAKGRTSAALAQT